MVATIAKPKRSNGGAADDGHDENKGSIKKKANFLLFLTPKPLLEQNKPKLQCLTAALNTDSLTQAARAHALF